MVLSKAGIKIARALAQRNKDAKVIRKQKQARRKLIRSNDGSFSITKKRYEKPQGPRRFSKGSRTKQARRDAADSNKIEGQMDSAEQDMHNAAFTDRELEKKTEWQDMGQGTDDFFRNLNIRSGSHSVFKAERAKWGKLQWGGP